MDTNQDAVSPLAADLQRDIELGKQVVAAYKTGGKQAVIAMLPDVVTEVRKDIADVQAAMPTIKAGYKTTEFWLVAALFAANAVYVGLTKKTLPIDVNAIIATAVAIYSGFRHVQKTQ